MLQLSSFILMLQRIWAVSDKQKIISHERLEKIKQKIQKIKPDILSEKHKLLPQKRRNLIYPEFIEQASVQSVSQIWNNQKLKVAFSSPQKDGQQLSGKKVDQRSQKDTILNKTIKEICKISSLLFQQLVNQFINHKKLSQDLFNLKQDSQCNTSKFQQINHRDLTKKQYFTAQDYQCLEESLQKSQAQIRKHIRIEQQIKIFVENMQQQIETLESKNIDLQKQNHSLKNTIQLIQKEKQQLGRKFKLEIQKASKQDRASNLRETQKQAQAKNITNYNNFYSLGLGIGRTVNLQNIGNYFPLKNRHVSESQDAKSMARKKNIKFKTQASTQQIQMSLQAKSKSILDFGNKKKGRSKVSSNISKYSTQKNQPVNKKLSKKNQVQKEDIYISIRNQEKAKMRKRQKQSSSFGIYAQSSIKNTIDCDEQFRKDRQQKLLRQQEVQELIRTIDVQTKNMKKPFVRKLLKKLQQKQQRSKANSSLAGYDS